MPAEGLQGLASAACSKVFKNSDSTLVGVSGTLFDSGNGSGVVIRTGGGERPVK